MLVYRSGEKKNKNNNNVILDKLTDKAVQRFFVLMAREMARLGATTADE